MLDKVVKALKKYRQRKMILKYKNYIKLSDKTILQPSFNIQIALPREQKEILKIGSSCIIDSNFIFEKDTGKIEIGDRVHIGGGTNLISINSIIVEDDVTIAWGCTIYDHNSHSVEWEKRMNDTIQEIQDLNQYNNFIKNKNWDVVSSSPIHICKKVWVGFGVTILKGVTIGEGAVIGAMSVVTKDVPPYTIVAGNPAKVVKITT